MEIKNRFNELELKEIAQQIHDTIESEQLLTSRTLASIRGLLRANNCYISLEKNDILGFISQKNISDQVVELQSWYVVPSRRNQKIGSKLLQKAINDTTKVYLASTFSPKIAETLHEFGFIYTKLHKLPLHIALKYLSERRITSVIKHLFKTKSYLLIKNANT